MSHAAQVRYVLVVARKAITDQEDWQLWGREAIELIDDELGEVPEEAKGAYN